MFDLAYGYARNNMSAFVELQQKVEARNFDIRKNILKFDDRITSYNVCYTKLLRDARYRFRTGCCRHAFNGGCHRRSSPVDRAV